MLIRRKQLVRSREIAGHSLRPMMVLVIAAAAVLATASGLSAQITAQGLIGSAVSQIGPRFSDVDEAIKRFQNGDAEGARMFLDKAKEKNPELPPTEITLARMYYAAKNAAGGRQLLEQAVTKHPDDPETYLIFAEQALAAGRATDASFLFEKANELNQKYEANAKRKRNIQIRCYRGPTQIALSRRNWKDAKRHLEAWLAIDPDKVDVMQNLGRAQFMLDDARSAYQSFENAGKVNKGLASADLMIAQLYHQKGNQENAEKFFERAITAAGDKTTTQIVYAKWLMGQDKFGDARSHLDRALKIDPESVEALLLRGIVAQMENKLKDAEKYLSLAHSLSPALMEPTNQLSLLLVEQDDKKKKARAQRYAAMNRRLYPEDANTGITLAWVLYQNNQRSQAGQILQAALKQRGAGLDSNYFTAKILYDGGNRKVASRVLTATLASKGTFLRRKEAQQLLDKIAAETN